MPVALSLPRLPGHPARAELSALRAAPGSAMATKHNRDARSSPSPSGPGCVAPFDELTLGLIGRSDAIAEVRARIRLFAVWNFPVMILGPTGSGKELVARALH
ncbi:MAG: sigma 54-interacting transcriptional regulator, partial [Deltaproteobacteria bacterium]|nr:sigma 54-interacting transcriptional regulator [Deltaproteobacteria bacterium]